VTPRKFPSASAVAYRLRRQRGSAVLPAARQELVRELRHVPLDSSPFQAIASNLLRPPTIAMREKRGVAGELQSRGLVHFSANQLPQLSQF